MHATLLPGVSSFTARLFRPVQMSDFSEMINLFTLVCHGLAVCSVLVLGEFFQEVVYDLIRLRRKSWQLAHEVVLVMFKKVEDSGGTLTIGKVQNEVYLNSVLDEAEQNVAAFFRPRGENPQLDGTPGAGAKQSKTWNGKFTSSGRPCPYFNLEDPRKPGHSRPHPADALLDDGTCRFNHVCDHWVSGKGKNGRCLCSAGTPGHARFACNHPKRCESAEQ